MLILLSCAKTMSPVGKLQFPFHSIPQFSRQASEIALYMSQFSVEELERLLRVHSKIAVENFRRYQAFHGEEAVSGPAVFAYTGIVFKRLSPRDFTEDQLSYMQDHLRITSFCYGLLRPMDLIRLYRLEGDVRIPELGGQTLFSYWKARLTDVFIEDIRKAGGVLCNLASEEMKGLFDWRRVEKEVKVVTPEFRVRKNDKLTTIVIYTKMNRGELARHILRNRIEDPKQLCSYTWEGFEYQEGLSDEKTLVFTNGF
ncbi:MAG: peroxide stress protein YaaA [Bacteroides sp.]|nr:peroxide stress protein YaaA [Bacteroides sp.]